MKTRFPKLQGFLIKPKKDQKEDSENLNFSTAFVYKGHIFATDGKVSMFFNLKEYLKYYSQAEDDEGQEYVIDLIKKIVTELEGKTLSREFFSVFSKMQTITGINEEKIFIEQNGFHSEYVIDGTYKKELLEKLLSKAKNIWTKERSEQGQFCVSGNVISSITSVLSAETSADALIFERTSDDKVRFCFTNKDFIFGLCVFDTNAEQSISKFVESDDFFELQID